MVMVGIGNAALAPRVTKQVIDLYLKPILIGRDPWDIEFLWQHMYRKTMAFGRKGIGMAAISAVDIALWDILGKSREATRVSPARRKDQSHASPSTPADSTASRSANSPPKRKRYKDEGYQAMKLRFGWGPTDGAAGMQHNVDLVRTVRETVGEGIDVMADAYMGWTLDYAKRMLPLLEPFNLRWLEEPVIPDDIHGYAELKSYGRMPIAGGEHEFTLYGFRELLEARARGLHSVRHQSRRRHHPSPQDLRAGGGLLGSGDSARRPDAQLSRRDGQLELAHGGIFPRGGRRSRQRTVLVHLRRRAAKPGTDSSISTKVSPASV